MTLDDVVFLGDKIPQEVLRVLPLLPHISKRSLTRVLSYVVKFLTGELLREKQDELAVPLNGQLERELRSSFEKVKKKSKYVQEVIDSAIKTGLFSVIFTGFYIILRAMIRQRIKIPYLRDQLKEMELDEDLINLFVEAYETKKQKFIALTTEKTSWFNHIVNVRWRVDVTISNSVMSKVFKPLLLLQFELSNSRIVTMEVTLEQFHKLRLSVATILNDMHNIESHPIMKIKE
ncbi:hypothetical protein FDP41_005255 [Naegleria fowleri]|uniref:COMM domain-containing protein 5 n=1 Tax=Naegleria fowleri TaxID=5763 RepID=A0A6A5BP25_NAEFO|nr:uncharacterized protein FDP41_005255 [Naegleria fowleri]KAF0975928.1 hypothetical protein FDP41_005255 [Naegleria fowleri]CAG4713583.1 unnamed protein product [Naegleria fowleri]